MNIHSIYGKLQLMHACSLIRARIQLASCSIYIKLREDYHDPRLYLFQLSNALLFLYLYAAMPDFILDPSFYDIAWDRLPERFLESLDEDPELKDVLYCTSGMNITPLFIQNGS